MQKLSPINLDITLVKLIADSELTQVRVNGSAEHRDSLIAELQLMLEDDQEARLDPVKVVKATDKTSDFHSEVYYLADGFHRYHAYKALGITDYPAIVVSEGDEREARLQALKANSDHKIALYMNDKDRAKVYSLALELLTEGLPEHKRTTSAEEIAAITGAKPTNGHLKRTVAAFNKAAKQARNELITGMLKVGELTHREIAEEAGCNKNTVLKLSKLLSVEIASAQNQTETEESKPFDPETFFAELEAEEEPESNNLNEDEYFKVKPSIIIEVETRKKAYKTGDQRYSFAKEAKAVADACPPEVKAIGYFYSVYRDFKSEYDLDETAFNLKQMKEIFPEKLERGLGNLRRFLSALELAGIASFVETEINNEPVAANSELPIIETAS